MMENPKLVPKLTIICPIHLCLLATVALNNYLSCSVRTCFFPLNLIAHSFRTDKNFGFPVAGGVNTLIRLCKESGPSVVPGKLVNLANENQA